MVLTKPPPKPPKFFRSSTPLEPKNFSLATRQLEHYQLPMVGIVPAWLHILEQCGYPTDVLVIDFETYFDTEYRMSRGSGEGLSTIEYVQDKRFEVLGCAFTPMMGSDPFADYTKATHFQATEDMVATQLKCYQKRW